MQMVRSRTAQGVSSTIAIAMVRRLVVPCFPHDADADIALTIRQTASNRSCTRSRSVRPIGAARRESVKRLPDQARQNRSPAPVQTGSGAPASACSRPTTSTKRSRRNGRSRALMSTGRPRCRCPPCLGDQPHDLVAQPLLQVDTDVRVRGKERAQRLREKLGERVGVAQDPDWPAAPPA
jgi:hypothetical protein